MEKKKNKEIVDSIMASIREYLVEEYGAIQSQWELTLLLLEDELSLYLKCRDEINKSGIFDEEFYRKNPLISTQKDLNASILKKVQHLGISPYACTKISNLSDAASDNDLLKNLMLMDENN